MDRRTFISVVALTVFAAAIGFMAAVFTGSGGNIAQANIFGDLFGRIRGITDSPASDVQNKTDVPSVTPYEPSVSYEEAVVRAVEHGAPSVISIIITKDLPVIENCQYDPFGDLPPEFRKFFGPFEFERPCQRGTKQQEVGGGSGFIISKDGFIVTNKHVVSDEDASYTVLTNSGEKYPATVLARDPVQDLAIVQVKAPPGGFQALELGDSDSIKLGQTAIAIGNALGEFRDTVSVGIISGLARSIDASGGGSTEHLEGLIQTDAAINPGNSGGPLLNLQGDVIGINTAIARGAENIGFAIPVNQVKRAIESVRRTGKISVPYLGVRFVMITHERAKREELPVDYGALVRGSENGPAVIADSPAAKAGLLAEDIITAVDGVSLSSNMSLLNMIQKYNVGDAVKFAVLRDGRKITITVTLGERPEQL